MDAGWRALFLLRVREDLRRAVLDRALAMDLAFKGTAARPGELLLMAPLRDPERLGHAARALGELEGVVEVECSLFEASEGAAPAEARAT